MPPIPHNSDQEWMQRTLHQVKGGRGLCWPNLPFDCVIVKVGAVVDETSMHLGGRPRAARKALKLPGRATKGASPTATLGSCYHWATSPPRAAAGVARVVFAIQDPDRRKPMADLQTRDAQGAFVVLSDAAAAPINAFRIATR